ncbi:MAG: hypothetical protein KatS3mg110_3156 [Pirellulaceae bacterium]|nr:MAG: hypothetical protein KatS3mg110_3156 [Pirellulaceae bacterium]
MRSVAISEQGTRLSAEGDCLVVWRGEHPVRKLRATELDQVLLYGNIDISHGALLLLVRRGADLVWLTQHGQFRARLMGPTGKNSLLRLAHYRAVCDAQFCLHIASRLVAAKIHQQRQILLRAQRRLRNEAVAEALGELRLLAQRVTQATELESLRGLEGRAAALYFQHFGQLIQNPDFSFTGRTRRPPRDPINAMLSFGYAVLGSHLMSDVLACGLDPMLGFFHQPQHGRPALMLDLLELYRPWVDQLVLRLVNRRQIGCGDFDRRLETPLEELLSDSSDPTADEVLEIAPWETDGEGSAADGESPGSAAALQQATPEPAAPAGPPVPGSHAPEADQPSVTALPADAPLETPPFDTPCESPLPPEQVASSRPGCQSVVGVFLNETGRKIFLGEFFHKLREERFYGRRQARYATRDIMREEIYYLARVIEGQETPYEPFILDER